MELIEQLKKDGIDKGLCQLWQGKLKAGLTTEELAKLYIQGIDFCISNDYPTLDFLRKHFKGQCEPFGVYVDDDIDYAYNKPDMVLNGDCRAIIGYGEYSVSRLYVRHTSEIIVVVEDNAMLTLDVFDNAKVHLMVTSPKAKVIVNTYGNGAAIDNQGQSNYTIVHHDKPTY